MSTNRALWDRELGTVVDYPRDDDEPVVMLDTNRYVPLTIIREPYPECPAGYTVCATRTVNLDSAEWFWGWKLVKVDSPDWGRFKRTVMAHPQINLALGGGLGQVPAAAMALPAAVMSSASGGDVGDFRGAWIALRREGLISSELLLEIRNLAIDCNLPESFVVALGGSVRPEAVNVGQEWIASDGTLWRVEQARDEGGQFLPDDSETPGKESLAWVEVMP